MAEQCLILEREEHHNIDAAVYGARAAFIGGAASTATVLAGQMLGIPVSGTMAHQLGDEI